MVFPVVMYKLWELRHKEGRTPKKQFLWTAVQEKTPESPLDSKEIKPVNLKGDQPWVFTGRTEAEAPVFWLSDENRGFIGKVPDAGKDWGQKKRASEDEIAGWHHQHNRYELGKLWEMVRDREAWYAAVHRVAKCQTWLGDWRIMCFIYLLSLNPRDNPMWCTLLPSSSEGLNNLSSLAAHK